MERLFEASRKNYENACLKYLEVSEEIQKCYIAEIIMKREIIKVLKAHPDGRTLSNKDVAACFQIWVEDMERIVELFQDNIDNMSDELEEIKQPAADLCTM